MIVDPVWHPCSEEQGYSRLFRELDSARILKALENEIKDNTKFVVLTTALKQFLFPEQDPHKTATIAGRPVHTASSWRFGYYLANTRPEKKNQFIIIEAPAPNMVEVDIIDRCVSLIEKHIELKSFVNFRDCTVTCNPDGFVRKTIQINSLLYKVSNEMLGNVVTDIPSNGGIHYNAYFNFRKSFDRTFEETGVATIDKRIPFNMLRIKLMQVLASKFMLTVGDRE